MEAMGRNGNNGKNLDSLRLLRLSTIARSERLGYSVGQIVLKLSSH